MKITITVVEAETGNSLDIQVDNRQRIKTTLRVLSENIKECSSFQTIDEIRVRHSGRRVSAGLTYEQAEIYTGAEIMIKKGER